MSDVTLPLVLDEPGVTMTFHRDPSGCFFDSYTLCEPSVSQSGNWEVWSTEAEGSDDVEKFEDVEFVPEDLLVEIELEAEIPMAAVHFLLAAFKIGQLSGESIAKREAQQKARFAFASLTGEIDGQYLDEAAEQYFHDQRKQAK